MLVASSILLDISLFPILYSRKPNTSSAVDIYIPNHSDCHWFWGDHPYNNYIFKSMSFPSCFECIDVISVVDNTIGGKSTLVTQNLLVITYVCILVSVINGQNEVFI